MNVKILRNVYGERIKEERKRLGLTQVQLATLTGVSERAQRNYENEGVTGSTPNLDYLSIVANVGMDAMYILTGKRSDPP